MADLLSLLSQSSSSLAAQSGALATASNNASNANTPGYSRQIANLTELSPEDLIGGAYIGRGAQLTSVTQARDKFLEAQLPSAFSQAASSAAASSALQSVSALNPGATGGLADSLSNFYSGLQALEQDPGDVSLRQAAIGDAQTLVQTFNSAGAALTSARAGLDTNLSGSTSQANQLASTIASLNQQIRTASASGASPNSLLDSRQQAMDQLTQLTGAQPVPDANGDMSMVLGSGQALVSGDRAGSLSTIPDPTNSGHLKLQLTAADGSGPTDVSRVGGSMGGWITARDGALETAQSSLDTLAYDFANKVNSVQTAGYGLDGVTGRAMFDVGGSSAGAASAITVDAAVANDPNAIAASSSAATVPGDATNLEAMISTQDAPLSTGQNAGDGLASITSEFGAEASGIAAQATQDQSISDNLTTMRDSVSGVSIDDEMINMTKSQQVYDAITKVISTTDQMLQTLLQIQ